MLVHRITSDIPDQFPGTESVLFEDDWAAIHDDPTVTLKAYEALRHRMLEAGIKPSPDKTVLLLPEPESTSPELV